MLFRKCLYTHSFSYRGCFEYRSDKFADFDLLTLEEFDSNVRQAPYQRTCRTAIN